MNPVFAWFKKQLGNPQVVILTGILLSCFLVIFALGRMLIPLLASLVIAYLLDGAVRTLSRTGIPRIVWVGVVFSLFMALLVLAFFWLIPLLLKQITQLVQQIPTMIAQTQELLMQLPDKYPRYISHAQINEILSGLRHELVGMGQKFLANTVSSLIGLITLLVYFIIVPLLVFFYLKDKDKILGWIEGFLPRERALAKQVWREVNRQIGNYIRGKTWEVLIVWATAYIVFMVFGLQYALLLSLTVGLSVLIPYVGAAVTTVPVALVAFFQWGVSPQFLYVLAAYLIIQILDGNVLAPLLFAEVVNLHPVATIAAVLIFGGLWGFWGVFFAIPLATLVEAVLTAWPRDAHPRAEPGA